MGAMSLAAREVHVGDAIWDAAFTPVLLAKLHEPRDLVRLTLSTGLALTATGNHVVMRADGSEVRLDSIVVGDSLLTTGNIEVRIEAIGAAIGRPMELNTQSRRICVGAPLHVEKRRGGVIVADSACYIESVAPLKLTAEPSAHYTGEACKVIRTTRPSAGATTNSASSGCGVHTRT